MTRRENLLRAVRFERPESIPMTFHINPASWNHYPADVLRGLIAEHPSLFPNGVSAQATPSYGPNQRAGAPHTDGWGCVWETSENGITGTVTRHPLADWAALESFTPPDPASSDGLGPHDWGATRAEMARARAEGRLTQGALQHGHTFLRLCDLRGYENLMFDMADDDPRLRRLIGMVEDFNRGIVRHFMGMGVEWMSYPEDLGMQVGPMLSPEHFRKHIKPSYQRLMAPAREAGCIVHMHSDGDIRTLAEDLIEGGVQVINLQDLVNGLDWIAGRFAGRVCVELDVDRQQITPYGTPAQCDALIREEVEKLGSREGGLMLIYGLYPGVPLVNVKALMNAMERYAGYYA